jgi:hypothetical protein
MQAMFKLIHFPAPSMDTLSSNTFSMSSGQSPSGMTSAAGLGKWLTNIQYSGHCLWISDSDRSSAPSMGMHTTGAASSRTSQLMCRVSGWMISRFVRPSSQSPMPWLPQLGMRPPSIAVKPSQHTCSTQMYLTPTPHFVSLFLLPTR